MRTHLPTMLAEMNPDWPGLTAQDLLHRSDDSSDSVEVLTSEEEEMDNQQDSDSDEQGGSPNTERVVTYPARLTGLWQGSHVLHQVMNREHVFVLNTSHNI